MRNGIRLFATICLASFLILSCGGSGGGAGSVGAESTTAANSDTSAGGAETTEANATTTATEAPSDGGTAAGVCELVTGDELAGIFGVASVTTTVIPGPPDNCIVESDTGDPLAAWSLTTAQALSVFDAFTTDPATVAVPGIGDKAAIVANTGLLVLKGDNLLVITITGGAGLSEDEATEASKQIAAFAAGRL
jgi:hypothetical protein